MVQELLLRELEESFVRGVEVLCTQRSMDPHDTQGKEMIIPLPVLCVLTP
jgi:hypothetical protein